MRLSFVIALFLLTFIGCNNDLACADKPVKEETHRTSRTLNELTEGIERDASATEDKTTTVGEERGTIQKLASFKNQQSAGILHNQAAISNTLETIPRSLRFGYARKTLNDHPDAIQMIKSLERSLSKDAFKTSEEKAAAIVGTVTSPSVIRAAKSIDENPKARAELYQLPAAKSIAQSLKNDDKRSLLSRIGTRLGQGATLAVLMLLFLVLGGGLIAGVVLLLPSMM